MCGSCSLRSLCCTDWGRGPVSLDLFEDDMPLDPADFSSFEDDLAFDEVEKAGAISQTGANTTSDVNGPGSLRPICPSMTWKRPAQ